MLDVSLALFWLGLAASLTSIAAYGAYALGVPAGVTRFAGQTGAGTVSIGSPRRPANPAVGRAATATALLTALLLTGAIGARWNAIGHIPLSNMYEATLGLAWGTVVVYLVLERVTGQRRAGIGVLPLVTLFLVVAALLPSDVVPLIPALQNEPLLTIHVAAVITAFAVLTVAFGGACIYLVQGGGRERRFSWLPRADAGGDLAHRAVLVGFPLLGLGIALGAWWANSAWGRYWGWDPKETSALMVWLSLVAYFHARAGTGTVAAAPGVRRIVPAWLRKGWRPDPMWWLVAMFGLLLFTYFAVNFWVTGLHSYAGV